MLASLDLATSKADKAVILLHKGGESDDGIGEKSPEISGIECSGYIYRQAKAEAVCLRSL